MNHNDFETHIRDAGSGIALTPDERVEMRARLVAYLSYTPSAWAAWLRRPALVAGLAALVLVTGSGGAALAAEGALPGDALYPVKVGVTEPLRLALASSSETRIALVMSLAERRLEEAAQLAEEDRLTDETEAVLAERFAAHAHAAAATEASTTGAIAVTATDFSARLAAHEHVLATLEAGRKGAATLALRGAIRDHIKEAAAPAAAGAGGAAAAQFGSAADVALTESAAAVNTLSASSSLRAEKALLKAREMNEKGRELLKQNDARGATRAFRSSLKAAAEIEVLAKAARTLHINTFSRTTTSMHASATGPNRSATDTAMTMGLERGGEGAREENLLEIELE